MGVPLRTSWKVAVASFEEQEKQWLAMPMGEVLAWLTEKKETLWVSSSTADWRTKSQMYQEYDKVESLQGSLARVVAWLACMQPPEAVTEDPVTVPEAPVVAVEPEAPPKVRMKHRARGRVCFLCRKQIRKTTELVTLCPVQLPGLPVHDMCLEDLEIEFGGKQ